MMRRRLFGCLLILLQMLSSCGPATPAVETTTLTRTPFRSPTSTRASTWTPQPTLPPETIAQNALEDVFRPLCPHPHVDNISTDGNWILCMDNDDVISREGTIWGIDYQALFGEEVFVDTRIVNWSRDGQYLFFSPFRSLDGIRPSPENAIALFQMDLTSGEVDTILSGNPRGQYYVLSMSPTGRRLAYIPPGHVYDQVIIKILDMSNGEENEISLDSSWSDAGWFSWSADGLELTVEALALGTGYYRLTYDVRTLELIDSHAFLPMWVEDLQQTQPFPEGTPPP